MPDIILTFSIPNLFEFFNEFFIFLSLKRKLIIP